MFLMSGVNFLTNFRIVIFEIYMLYLLQVDGGWNDHNMKVLKGYGIAQITIGFCVLLPLYGLNSALDTFVAQTAGSIGEDQNIVHLCGIYLIRGRSVMALFYGPLMIILSLSQRLWPKVWRVPSIDEDGNPCNVGDDLSIEHASIFISSFFIGTFFCCLNDL